MYLELIVIEALKYKPVGDLSNNFLAVLTYLKNDFVEKLITDPSNSNNRVSDVLYRYEKEAITIKAEESLSKQYWEDIVW